VNEWRDGTPRVRSIAVLARSLKSESAFFHNLGPEESMEYARRLAVLAAAAIVAGGAGGAAAQHMHHHGHHGQATPASAAASAPAPVRIAMDALHAAGGVPPGWRFTLTPGDPAAGRQAFVDLKCYACHAIRGEQFPLKPGEAATVGPDLSGVGQHHPKEYLVESIVNPNAVIVDAPGYAGGDGRSLMPESPQMTVAQLGNLVAYLGGRRGGGVQADGRGDAKERQAGRYRVRLSYLAPGAGHAHGAGGHHDHAAARGPGRLVAVVTDLASGQPVPYLPVRAVIETPGKPAIALTLGPRLGPEGFRYEGAVALPAETRRIEVSVGASTARLLGGEPGAFARPEHLSFAWR
jgi:hypothetical protein